MDKIGRNDPCPCGSGQKYKKCCLAKDGLFDSRRREEEHAVHIALSWLDQYFPEEIGAAVSFDFMDEPDEDRLEALGSLSPQLDQAITVNIGEWLLADAELAINGKDIPAKDLILGKGGSLLTAHGREWLRELGKRPLSIYEVREIMKGKGLVLADMVHPDQPLIQIREKAATGVLVPWDTFGARLVWQDDSFVMSGAVYPMDRETALDCLAEIKSEIECEDGDATIARYITASTIIDYWINSILETKPLPELVDASTGENIDLTTDHYKVANWRELEKILDAQEDVEGDRVDGWTRFIELEDGRRRSRASLNPKKPGSLEVFCRTIKLADEARAWLEGIAGCVVTYKIREVVDPRSERRGPVQSPHRSRTSHRRCNANSSTSTLPSIMRPGPRFLCLP
jgi:hypothetical protein